MREIVTVENLKAYYFIRFMGNQTTVRAVNGVDFKVCEGEIYGIAGESGCGKSTLLKVLFGYTKPPLRLVDGSVIYDFDSQKLNITAVDHQLLRRVRWKYISYVPQGSMNVLNPVRKVRKIFMDVLAEHTDMSKEEAFYEVEKYFEALGLPLRVLDSFPHQLSGGMRQRVTIALATILKPKVILADEPTTALDVVVQRGVIQLLKDIHDEQKCTLIIVTHDMGVHAHLSSRICVMYAGKIVEEAPSNKMFKDPLHPYTKLLINSLPSLGDRRRREGIPGAPPSLSNLPPGCPFHPRCPSARSVCMEREPALVTVERDRRVACWMVEG
ncbi:MAG: ABC transporter ATP-binding protein [Nitrososphaerota archaeon]